MTILVEKTDRYTIEFWFKANVDEFKKILEPEDNPAQKRTFLFMMNGRADGISESQLSIFSFNTMVIYVEDDEMKCAPFGFVDGEVKDPDSLLTYKGVNPLKVSKWQHISCIFVRQKFVKGQYLAVDLDEEGADTATSKFRDNINRPLTFAKQVYK